MLKQFAETSEEQIIEYEGEETDIRTSCPTR